MDVTFTNVLEGARQYFQGLPAVTCSTSNSLYTNGEHHNNHIHNAELNQDRNAAQSFWPQHQEPAQVRGANQEKHTLDSLHRPPSHHSDSSRPPSHNQVLNSHHTEQARNSNNYHVQQNQQQLQTSSYQFPRPHSREVANNVQHQQYQSHILPNPYHQSSSAQQMQNRVPNRVSEQMNNSSSHSYHQLQPASHIQHTSQAYSNYQQTRSYYPVSSQPQTQQNVTYHNSYQSTPAATYPQGQEASYNNQNFVIQQPNESQYATAAKQHSSHNQEEKPNNALLHPTQSPSVQNQQPLQHKTTHNLPPIAALSSVNYHSIRSNRDAVRLSNNKGRPQASSSTTTSATPCKSASNTSNNMQYGHQNNVNSYASTTQYSSSTQNRAIPNNNNYQYVANSATPNTSGYVPTNLRNSVDQSGQQRPTNNANYVNYQQPSIANIQQETYNKTYQASNAKPNPAEVPQQNKTVNTSMAVSSVNKQKRESPLDLSVKTVRTSADSTLNDSDPHSTEAQRISKYYQNMKQSNQTANYPAYDSYPNAFQRNDTKTPHLSTAASAPKVDFLPNFNVPALNQPANNKTDNRVSCIQNTKDGQRIYYDKKAAAYPQQPSYPNNSRLPVNSMSAAAHTNSKMIYNTSTKKSTNSIPRVDFPPSSHKTPVYPPTVDMQRKRNAETSMSAIPNKVTKVDVWRQTIDQQIEQRLSSYAKQKREEQQNYPLAKPLINGNYIGAQDRPKEAYPLPYSRSQYNTFQTHQSYTNPQYQQMPKDHNQTYVPTGTAHQYSNFSNNGSQQLPMQYSQNLVRTNSNPTLPLASSNKTNVGGAADRRVLSLLRNSLEIKGAKEAQKKLEQEQYKIQETARHHPRSDIQQPSTDVMAPFQPKTGVVGRHNVSPFAATSLLERNSNTPPTYKFHLPRAIDSIRYDGADAAKDSTKIPETKRIEENYAALNPSPSTDLDGLAAFLAARIRTKAELKQVGPTQNVCSNNNGSNLVRSTSETHLTKLSAKMTDNLSVLNLQNATSATNLQKLSSEKSPNAPRRRLFSRNDEESGGTSHGNVPPRDKSGLRSSSEASVFDFPDSDSETEMPVLERQTLLDMRRDRRNNVKLPQSEEYKIDSPRSVSPADSFFDEACNKFMEQLKIGNGKKRGRRKKGVEPDVLAKLETATKENPLEVTIKIERTDVDDVKSEEMSLETESVETTKLLNDSDSDTPLIKCKSEPITELVEEQIESGNLELSHQTDLELINNLSKETKEAIATIEKSNEEKINNLKTSELTIKSLKPTKKPTFGDGSEFRPGWEEEVYNYKRSLRMPLSLIHVTRPPYSHRLSTSLPDLDPCPNSPTLSSVTDNLEFSKATIKTETVDSDLDSNCSFNFSLNKSNYDSEEGGSVKSLNLSQNKPKSSISILDRLIERYGARKKRKNKKREDESPKTVPKSENPVELLPTPSLEIENVAEKKSGKKSDTVIKGESVFLGFRKSTIDNFKDTFIKSPNKLVGVTEQFNTVILKSRTRTETRVLKQRATIREVFGEDRPASAPPVTCLQDTETIEELDDKSIVDKNAIADKEESPDSEVKSVIDLKATKQVLKNTLLNRGQKQSSFLKALASKKLGAEFLDDMEIKADPDAKSETPSIEDETVPSRKRMKNIRRKFSSGFDYIRKKKKQSKKCGTEADTAPKIKRKLFLPKSTPESVQDIQKEVKMWVMNKGIGETHLHRAARLGYTDITAYCLEKMEGTASPKDNAGYTPLHEACARGHIGIAKLLLLYGANVSESAQGGIRPLHEAAENGYVELVRLLLSYGADPTLATYSGLTPLSLATDESTIALLQNHIAETQGKPSAPWTFSGPATCFDPEDSGYDPLVNVPSPDPPSEEEDIEFEISEMALPNLYTLRDESQSEKWILLQDLSNILKIKSRDALLRRISSATPSTSTSTTNYKNIIKEMKMGDFLEQARCCQYLCAGEKINTRASKIALVKYSDKVKQLLCVENLTITAR